MNKIEKVFFFVALALIVGSLILAVFFPGWPLFIPLAIGCVLLQVLRETSTDRAHRERMRDKIKRKARSGKRKLTGLLDRALKT